MTRRTAPRVLLICGTANQTTQMHAVARHLPECNLHFSPFYSESYREWMGRVGLLENSIMGSWIRAQCLDYLRSHELSIDLRGQNGPYDLVISCSDLLIPENVDERRLLVVQEGMLDLPSWWSHVIQRLRLPPYYCGTVLTGARGRYARMCVASEGFRQLIASRGGPLHKMVITGIPNFDNCAAFHNNNIPERGFLLAATSDLRETFRVDHRRRFLERLKELARGREIIIKLHPNERKSRALREISEVLPEARVFTKHKVEELIANCAALVTQVSSTTFVGLALGKEVYSDLDLDEMRGLLPLQNGGASAVHIADECRDLLGLPRKLHRVPVGAPLPTPSIGGQLSQQHEAKASL